MRDVVQRVVAAAVSRQEEERRDIAGHRGAVAPVLARHPLDLSRVELVERDALRDHVPRSRDAELLERPRSGLVGDDVCRNVGPLEQQRILLEPRIVDVDDRRHGERVELVEAGDEGVRETRCTRRRIAGSITPRVPRHARSAATRRTRERGKVSRLLCTRSSRGRSSA